MEEGELNCERCEKDCEELITRTGFKTTFYCEFVCEDCFLILENELLVKTETENE